MMRGSIARDIPLIGRLSDPSFARGLITFLISVATIGLAFVLVYQASSSSDDSFRRAREVFAGLMGILGTIVGFYFGSADKTSAKLDIAAVKFTDKQIASYPKSGDGTEGIHAKAQRRKVKRLYRHPPIG